MDETLQLLLRLAERTGTPTFDADDTRRWAPGTRDALLKLGVIHEIASTDVVYCDGCIEGHALNVDVREYPAGMIGVAMCRDCGRVHVPLDRLRQWRFSFGSLASEVARSIGITGDVSVDVADRVIFLGTAIISGSPREVFLARGLCRPDAAHVAGRAERLRAARRPVILLAARMPDETFWQEKRCSPVCLAEIATLADATIQVDTVALAEGVALPEAGNDGTTAVEMNALTEVEITVLEAMAESPNQAMLQVDIQSASGYSKAATRDALGRLRELEYVAEPHGKKRKGLAITARGQAFLEQRAKLTRCAVGAKSHA